MAHDKTATSARRIFKLFDSGAIIPFFTSSHFEEMARHKSDSVFCERVELIRSLPFVRYPKLPQSQTHIGDTLEAREYEMAILVHYPAASHAFIIEHGRSEIINGFCSGLELCKANSKWWSYYRTHFADYILARDADIASLCHFPDPALSSDARLPRSSKNLQLRPKEEVLELYILEGILPFEIEQIKNQFIGTERGVNRPESAAIELEKPMIRLPALERLKSRSPRDAAIVRRYFRDMEQALQTRCNILQPEGMLVIVCGDNLVAGERIRTWRVIADMVEELGLEQFDSFADRIKDRLLAPKRLGHIGLIKEEVVMAFRKNREPNRATRKQTPAAGNSHLSQADITFRRLCMR